MKVVTIKPPIFENAVHRGMRVLAELQRAGIPAFGVLFVEGVTHGMLKIDAPDIETGEVTYAWNEGDADPTGERWRT